MNRVTSVPLAVSFLGVLAACGSDPAGTSLDGDEDDVDEPVDEAPDLPDSTDTERDAGAPPDMDSGAPHEIEDAGMHVGDAARPDSGPCISFDPGIIYVVREMQCARAAIITPLIVTEEPQHTCLASQTMGDPAIHPVSQRLTYLPEGLEQARRAYRPQSKLRWRNVEQTWGLWWDAPLQDDELPWLVSPFESGRIVFVPEEEEVFTAEWKGAWYWSHRRQFPSYEKDVLAATSGRYLLVSYETDGMPRTRLETGQGQLIPFDAEFSRNEALIARSHGDGFHLVTPTPGGDESSMTLWQIDVSPGYAPLGEYAPFPADVTPTRIGSADNDAVLDPSGTLFLVAASETYGWAVVRLPLLPEAASIVLAGTLADGAEACPTPSIPGEPATYPELAADPEVPPRLITGP